MPPLPDTATLDFLIRASGLACCVWQGQTGNWLASPGLEASLGNPAEWTAWPAAQWQRLIHPDDYYIFSAALDALAAGTPLGERAVRLRARHGAWLRFAAQGTAHDGQSLLTLRDITTESQLESALHDSQQRLNSLYDAAPIAIILWSKEGRITGWNEMAASTFGHARDAVVGQKLVPLLIAPDDYDVFSQAISLSVAENAGKDVVCTTLTATGAQLRCRWRSVPLRTRKGALTGIFSLAQDVTAELAATDRLREAKTAAEKLSTAKSEFMAVVGHELRTPLNGILGMAQLLQTNDLDAENAELVNTIHDSGDKLLQIVNAILRYADADLVDEQQRNHLFSFSELLLFGCQPLEYQAGRKGLAFSLDLDPTIPDLVLGDEEALKSIIAHLGDNAVKFTDNGYVRIATRLLATSPAACTVEISVADSGCGMDEEFIGRLYQPFLQAENAILRKHGGVGLGLALVKKLVDRMGGQISVRSLPGAGTAFTVWCPVQPQALED